MENKANKEIILAEKNINYQKFDDYIFEKKEHLLDEGKANIGYTLEEAIMEAIDDSFDAKAEHIQIKLFDEIFAEFKGQVENSNSNTDIMARRCSYIICDNGCGVRNIKEVFNFGNKQNTKYKDKDEYLIKNSRFHYGFISHINVGNQIIFYSKTEDDDQWRGITLNYDRYINCGYVSNVVEMSEKEKEFIRAIGIKLPDHSGSVLYVRGIRKTEFDFRDIEKLKPNLIEQIGITYYEYLNGKYNITIDDTPIVGLSPLGEELNDELIKPNIFGEYEISLNEIFSKLDDNIAKEELILNFQEIFNSKEEILNETIKIKLVAINKNFTYNINKIREKFPNLKSVYFPRTNTSGFYIKRNKRYIGKALGMLNIVTDHPSHNRFRGEISFNPIFDEFFKIQINKNHNTLSKILQSLIKEKIEKDNNLEGSTVAAKIKIAIGAKEKEKSKSIKKNPLDSKIKKLKRNARKIRKNLDNYYEDTEQVEEVLKLLAKETLEINDIENIEQTLAQINTEYEKKYKCIYKDVTSLIKRISTDKKRKILKNIKNTTQYANLFSSIREPMQEGELYGIFYLIYKLFPEKFDFHLIGYDTNEGLDCLVQIDSVLFENLNFEERFGKQMEKIKDEIEALEELNDEDLYNQEAYYRSEQRICYLELKLKLTEIMNHSLVLASHIICWSKPKFEQIQADDDLYGFMDSTKTMLVNSNYGVTKKIKVIYLKDMIENIVNGKFKK